MESVRHNAILKSWVEVGILTILTRHLQVPDTVMRMSRTTVELWDFLDFLKHREFILGYSSRNMPYAKKVELFIAPIRTVERWIYGFDITCDESYFEEVDGAYGWRFKVDPETGELMIERFNKEREIKG